MASIHNDKSLWSAAIKMARSTGFLTISTVGFY